MLSATSETDCQRPRRNKPADPRTTTPIGVADCGANDLRQLRHLTKNALQRILSMISCAPELESRSVSSSLRDALERRVLITAKLSDALFGLTSKPDDLGRRLVHLSEGLVDLFTDDGVVVSVDVDIQCILSAGLDNLVVRLAQELVGNAIKHGMHGRCHGRIEIKVCQEPRRIVLTVVDDGRCDLSPRPTKGEGLLIVDSLLHQVHGTCRLWRADSLTIAFVAIPLRAKATSARPGSALFKTEK